MKHSISILIILLLCVASCAAYPLSPGDPTIQTSLDYLRDCQKSDGGFGEVGRESSPGTSSWAIMAAVAAGEDPREWVKDGNSTIDYLRSMNDEIMAKGGTVDIARTLLTLVAVGEDPRSFCGTDYVAELKSRVKPGGQAGDHVFTTIWTIIALASVGEDTDASAAWLASQQNADGGFPWTPGAESDPDDTGAALEALAAAGVSPDAAVVQDALASSKESSLRTVVSTTGEQALQTPHQMPGSSRVLLPQEATLQSGEWVRRVWLTTSSACRTPTDRSATPLT